MGARIYGTDKILTKPSEFAGRHDVERVWIDTEKQSTALVEFSDKENGLIEAFSKPALKETVFAHLYKITAHFQNDKKISDEVSCAFLIHDYTTRLVEAKVLEVDLFIALNEIIETEEFFPTYAKLYKKIFGKSEEKK